MLEWKLLITYITEVIKWSITKVIRWTFVIKWYITKVLRGYNKENKNNNIKFFKYIFLIDINICL